MQAVWHDYCMPWLPRAPVHYQTTSVLLNKAGEDHLLAQGAQLSSIQVNLLPHIRIRQPCSSWQLGTASDLCYPLNHAWTFTVMALNWPESKKKVLMSKLASKHYGWSQTALSPVLCLCLVGFYRNSFRYFSYIFPVGIGIDVHRLCPALLPVPIFLTQPWAFLSCRVPVVLPGGLGHPTIIFFWPLG